MSSDRRQGHTVIVVYDRLWDRHYEVVRGHLDLLATLAVTQATLRHSLCVRNSVRGVAVAVAAAAAAPKRTRRGVAVTVFIVTTTTTTTVVATKRRLVAVTVVAHSLHTQGSARGSNDATSAAAATSSTAAATATATSTASSTNQPRCWRAISASAPASGSVTATTRGHRVGWLHKVSLGEIGREMLNCGTVSACVHNTRELTAQTIANGARNQFL